MLNGRHALNLDAKGRIAIPSRQREKLMASCEGRVVLTQYHLDPCLVLYPEHEWQKVAEKVAALKDANEGVRRLKRLFLGQAVELELDGSGRILLPQELRSLVQLDKKAMLIGLLNRFEIWNEETWAERNQVDGLADELPQEALDLSF